MSCFIRGYLILDWEGVFLGGGVEGGARELDGVLGELVDFSLYYYFFNASCNTYLYLQSIMTCCFTDGETLKVVERLF